jgi:hypothetical protein
MKPQNFHLSCLGTRKCIALSDVPGRDSHMVARAYSYELHIHRHIALRGIGSTTQSNHMSQIAAHYTLC